MMYIGDDVNQEESERDEIDRMKEKAVMSVIVMGRKEREKEWRGVGGKERGHQHLPW